MRKPWVLGSLAKPRSVLHAFLRKCIQWCSNISAWARRSNAGVGSHHYQYRWYRHAAVGLQRLHLARSSSRIIASSFTHSLFPNSNPIIYWHLARPRFGCLGLSQAEAVPRGKVPIVPKFWHPQLPPTDQPPQTPWRHSALWGTFCWPF